MTDTRVCDPLSNERNELFLARKSAREHILNRGHISPASNFNHLARLAGATPRPLGPTPTPHSKATA